MFSSGEGSEIPGRKDNRGRGRVKSIGFADLWPSARDDKALGVFWFVCLFFGFGFFGDRVSLYSPGCPGTHCVDQAGLELRNLPASASQSAGITGVRHHHRA